jgi:hypothetical protein
MRVSLVFFFGLLLKIAMGIVNGVIAPDRRWSGGVVMGFINPDTTSYDVVRTFV